MRSKPKIKIGETTKDWLIMIGIIIGIHLFLLLLNMDFSEDETEEPKYKKGDIVETVTEITGYYSHEDLLISEGAITGSKLDWTDPYRTLITGKYRIIWVSSETGKSGYHSIELYHIQSGETSWVNDYMLDVALRKYD